MKHTYSFLFFLVAAWTAKAGIEMPVTEQGLWYKFSPKNIRMVCQPSGGREHLRVYSGDVSIFYVQNFSMANLLKPSKADAKCSDTKNALEKQIETAKRQNKLVQFSEPSYRSSNILDVKVLADADTTPDYALEGGVEPEKCSYAGGADSLPKVLNQGNCGQPLQIAEVNCDFPGGTQASALIACVHSGAVQDPTECYKSRLKTPAATTGKAEGAP